ncbi:MAG: hypothetical protein PHQ36_12370, partial [Anaerolineales bacterium]|nr:hypothetical protein [Anaerolineales bacterium]
IEHYAATLDLDWIPPRQSDLTLKSLLVSADRDIRAEDIPMLIEKYNAVAADWESGAIAWVAKKNDIRVLILRVVTDLVGGEGGEAYGNIELFRERTKTMMGELFARLHSFEEIIEVTKDTRRKRSNVT